MSSPELATEEGVITYLKTTPFVAEKVTQLTGGTGNYTYRIHLQASYAGRSSVVLKHAKPYVKNAKSIPFAIERQKLEAEVMAKTKKLLPSDSIVTVPTVHLFDEQACVIIMDDCGEGVPTLKDLLLTNPPSVEIGQAIGTAIGEFLAFFHTRGTLEKELTELVSGNAAGRQISSWVTYGRLVSTLGGKDNIPALSDPPLEVPKDVLDKIDNSSKEIIERAMTTNESIVMGDFWPGNILISLSPNGKEVKRLHVIDWEMSKLGIAGWDVGQFSAEIHLIRRFHPDREAVASATLSAFLKAYGAHASASVKEGDVARTALTHVGAHLVTWTPRVQWGEKEKTREVVEEGVKYYLEGTSDVMHDLHRSIVGELYE